MRTRFFIIENSGPEGGAPLELEITENDLERFKRAKHGLLTYCRHCSACSREVYHVDDRVGSIASVQEQLKLWRAFGFAAP
jgi:hypothetical protein